MSMTSPLDPALTGVVWKKTLKEDVRKYPPLKGEETSDVVIVGAGYCGLNAAIHAANSGSKVIVLEAGVVGGGASGRNGGYNVPHFPGALTPASIKPHLGRRKARDLSELVLNGANAVFRQIDHYQINCSPVQNGWVQPAHSDASLQKVRKVFEEWKAFGAPVSWHSQAETHDILGARGYVGSWSNSSGGTINPYGMAVGLGRAADQTGVKIFEDSAVEGIDQSTGTVVVRTKTGRVKCSTVIFATNAYTGDFLPAVQRSVVPVYLFHVATKPLREELRQSILKTSMCFTDLRKSGGFARLDPEGRLIGGGAVFAVPGLRQSYGERHAKKRFKLLFPQMNDDDLALENYWEGYCAVSESFLPSVQRLGANVFSVVGFSTRGVNLAQNLGRVIGEFAAGKRALADIPVSVVEQPRDVPLWPLKVRGARLIFPYYQAKDRLGMT